MSPARPADVSEVSLCLRWLLAAAEQMAVRGINQWTPASVDAFAPDLQAAQAAGELYIAPQLGAFVLRREPIDPLWSAYPVSADTAYLYKMVVLPELWGAGAGAALLAAVQDSARRLGLAQLRLDCVAHNTKLIRFYESHGFYPRGQGDVEGADGDHLSLQRFDKNLTDADALTKSLPAWQPEITGTLMFVVQAERVLLIHKKTGHGIGKVNGPGGKLEPGESAVECAVRETREELGIEVKHPREMARLRFVEQQGDQWLGYAYLVETYNGLPVETAEARPQWFFRHALPFDDMWADDRIWLPRVLEGEYVSGDFLFNNGVLLAHQINQ